jgi:hypothetical protein
MGMMKQLRVRSIIVAWAGFGLYLALNFDLIERHLAAHGFMAPYLIGLGLVVTASAWRFENRDFRSRMTWALLSPIVGSVVGYTAATIIHLTTERLYIGTPIEWVVIATVAPYMMLCLWVLSMLLLALSIANHRLSRLWSQAAIEGQQP